jgi:hypothetical protein
LGYSKKSSWNNFFWFYKGGAFTHRKACPIVAKVLTIVPKGYYYAALRKEFAQVRYVDARIEFMRTDSYLCGSREITLRHLAGLYVPLRNNPLLTFLRSVFGWGLMIIFLETAGEIGETAKTDRKSNFGYIASLLRQYLGGPLQSIVPDKLSWSPICEGFHFTVKLGFAHRQSVL